ncbi:MAG: cytochrome c oxidase subunit II [Hyphomicrobiales bacterium]|nr:cytochrome c oxidase subunit II [Hyphomicrobiales bacterium]
MFDNLASLRAWRPAVAGLALSAAISAQAFAEETLGHAVPGQMSLLAPATPVAENLDFFHNKILLPLCIIISLFVLALLVYVMVRFNEKANPVPSRTTHNAALEVAWTIIPVLILVLIAVPSFRLLTQEIAVPKTDMTIKVTGKQWYWSYEYPKEEGGGFGFDSMLKDEKDMKPGDLRLLAVDNEVVVPVNKSVLLQVTAADVIHSFVIQPFGVRIDAVPGRMNTSWFKAEKEGVFYGQCSKLCGKDHAFMPIVFRVVSQAKYDAWLADQKKKSASRESEVKFAAAAPRN